VIGPLCGAYAEVRDQWAGEKITSRDKTVVVEDELKELEQDIELRKQGILRYAPARSIHIESDAGLN
jgi:hypothetical protein